LPPGSSKQAAAAAACCQSHEQGGPPCRTSPARIYRSCARAHAQQSVVDERLVPTSPLIHSPCTVHCVLFLFQGLYYYQLYRQGGWAGPNCLYLASSGSTIVPSLSHAFRSGRDGANRRPPVDLAVDARRYVWRFLLNQCSRKRKVKRRYSTSVFLWG
jgi:hypothetical protein